MLSSFVPAPACRDVYFLHILGLHRPLPQRRAFQTPRVRRRSRLGRSGSEEVSKVVYERFIELGPLSEKSIRTGFLAWGGDELREALQ